MLLAAAALVWGLGVEGWGWVSASVHHQSVIGNLVGHTGSGSEV